MPKRRIRKSPLDRELLAGCSTGGTTVLRLGVDGGAVSLLDTAWTARPDSGCTVEAFAGGAIVVVGPSEVQEVAEGLLSEAFYVDRRGVVSTIRGIRNVAANRIASTALMVGPSGIVAVSADGGVRTVASQPTARIEFAGMFDDFLVQLMNASWGLVGPSPNGPSMREVAVSPTAVDVAPIPGFGGA